MAPSVMALCRTVITCAVCLQTGCLWLQSNSTGPQCREETDLGGQPVVSTCPATPHPVTIPSSPAPQQPVHVIEYQHEETHEENYETEYLWETMWHQFKHGLSMYSAEAGWVCGLVLSIFILRLCWRALQKCMEGISSPTATYSRIRRNRGGENGSDDEENALL